MRRPVSIWAVVDAKTGRIVIYANGVPACYKTAKEARETWVHQSGSNRVFRIIRLVAQEGSQS